MIKPFDYGIDKPSFRQYQFETAVKTVAAFQAGAKVVGINAPCGFGKSLECVLDARMLEVPMLYVCHTHALQQQFMRDYVSMGAEELKGRANYPCLKNPNANAELCTYKNPNCNICPLLKNGCAPDAKEHCPCRVNCPYEVQKMKTIAAPIGVLNMAYYLQEVNHAGGFDNRELVVLDEADETEKALMDFIELRISDSMVNRYNLTHPKFKTKPESWREWANETLQIVTFQLSKLNSLWGTEDLREKQQLERLKRKIEFFIVEADDGWVFDGVNTFKPIRVAKYAGSFLWKHADKFLLMSATLAPWHQLIRDLGIDDE
jgi:Rad3-related DNA helicase